MNWSAKKVNAPPVTIDLSAANVQLNYTTPARVFVDCEYDCKIRSIVFVYTAATDSAASAETIQVGYGSGATLYTWLNIAPTVSQAIGTVENKTVLNPGTLLPAGTPLQIQKSAATGTSNIGEITVCVELERINHGDAH
jgi:hypothetical protein